MVPTPAKLLRRHYGVFVLVLSLWRPSPEELTIRTDLCLGPLNEGEAEFHSLSDDQAIVTG